MHWDNHKTLIGTAAALLLLPQVISPFFRSDELFAKTENRNITPFPRNWKWRKIAPQLEEYYNDRIPFRRWLMPMSRNVHSVFFPKQSDLALVGRNNFLFICFPEHWQCPFLQHIGKYADPITHYDREKMLNYIREAQMHSEQNHAQFLMVIIPNKITIYSDMLPEKRRFRQQGFLAEDLVAAGHSADPKVHFLYLKQALLDYRKKMSCPLYFAQDTHWNFAGAYCGMKTILSRLALPWPKTWPLPEEASPRRGQDSLSRYDLQARAPVGTSLRKEADCRIDIPGEHIERIDLKREYFITENTNAFDQREVLVFHDSFGDALWHYLAAYFRKVHFCREEYNADSVEKIKPQLVIYSRIARMLPNFHRKTIR